MNQHDEIMESVRRVAGQTKRNNFVLLLVGGLIGALLVLAIVEEGPTKWAAAGLAALTGIAFVVSGYYHKKATGKRVGVTVGSLAGVGTALLAASELLADSPSVRMGLTIAALLFLVAFAVVSVREVWLLKKR